MKELWHLTLSQKIRKQILAENLLNRDMINDGLKDKLKKHRNSFQNK